MKHRIESDGTVHGTHVYGPDDQEIRGVRKVKFEIEVGKPSVLELTFRTPFPEVQIAVTTVTTHTGHEVVR